MAKFQLGASVAFHSLAIRVKDRDKMIAFYRDQIGFALKGEENALAILGTKCSEEERFFLEESPRAQDLFGTTKKLNHFLLTVQTKEEIFAIIARLKQANYPEYHVQIDAHQIQLTSSDPEENKLIVRYVQPTQRLVEQTVDELDFDQIDATIGLAANCQIAAIHLNVLDTAAQANFLEKGLGLVFDKTSDTWSIPSVPVQWSATATTDATVAMASHEVIGLEFIKLTISQADLVALANHLSEQNITFFIDKKQTILTVDDPVGVEWWFEYQRPKGHNK